MLVQTRRWKLAVGVALSLWATTVGAAPTASARCRIELLGALGWQFDTVPAVDPVAGEQIEGVRVIAGRPCERADLASAWAAGELRVLLPEHHPLDRDDALLDRLLADPATRCGYLFRLGGATRRAVDRLVDNRGYRFSGLQFGWIGFGFGGPGADGWRRTVSFGRGFQPAAGNWRAIEGFYRGRVRSECGVGRQIAQYASQAELYGADAFDREFDADEIVIGTFRQLHGTRSILLGRSAGELVRDGMAARSSRLGRQGFVGLPGFIVHSHSRDRLDDINNQAQNFVVYDVSQAAADGLRRHGGFAEYNRRSLRMWQLARTLDRRGRRYFERLLSERDPALRARLDAQQLAVVADLDRLLADPFFTGFRVYVHRHGVQPVGYHFVRMLDRNPRTPFQIELAMHNLHTTLYRRYVDHRLRDCMARTAQR